MPVVPRLVNNQWLMVGMEFNLMYHSLSSLMFFLEIDDSDEKCFSKSAFTMISEYV